MMPVAHSKATSTMRLTRLVTSFRALWGTQTLRLAICTYLLVISSGGDSLAQAVLDLSKVRPPAEKQTSFFNSRHHRTGRPLGPNIDLRLDRLSVNGSGGSVTYELTITNNSREPFFFPKTKDWRLAETSSSYRKGAIEYLIGLDVMNAAVPVRGSSFGLTILYGSADVPASYETIAPHSMLRIRVSGRPPTDLFGSSPVQVKGWLSINTAPQDWDSVTVYSDNSLSFSRFGSVAQPSR